MRKNLIAILSIIFVTVFIKIIFPYIFGFWFFSDIPFIQTKDYIPVNIDNSIVKADYSVFINVPDEYSSLEEIDSNLRTEISQYMKENNLLLKDGYQEFNGTKYADLDELIYEDFEFITIQEITENAKYAEMETNKE